MYQGTKIHWPKSILLLQGQVKYCEDSDSPINPEERRVIGQESEEYKDTYSCQQS
jgi:hypothetical protein